MQGVVPVLIVAAILTTVGLIDLITDLASLADRHRLTTEFQRRFAAFVMEHRSDDYIWLAQRETAMSTELGGADIVQYRAPFGMYTIQNLPLLSDTLIKLRTGDAELESVQAMDHILVRHGGALEDARSRLLAELRNPFRLIIRGVRTILGWPLLILVWTGLLRPSTARRAQASVAYRLAQLAVTLLLALAAVETLVIGWPAFVSQLRQWFPILR